MRKTVTINQFADEFTGLPDKLEKAVVRGLRSTAMRGVGIVTGEIDKQKISDTGALKQSVGFENITGGAVLKVDAPHAPHIEYGTRPHWAPLEPLILWAQRKLGLDEDDAEEVAEVIQFMIAAFGTEPKKFMSKSMVVIRKRVLPVEVDREVGQV